MTIISRAPSLCGTGWFLCVSHASGQTGLCPSNRLKLIPFPAAEESIRRSFNSALSLSDVTRRQPISDERRKSWTEDNCYDIPKTFQHLYDVPLLLSSSSGEDFSLSLESFERKLSEEEMTFEEKYSVPKSSLYDIPNKNPKRVNHDTFDTFETYDSPKNSFNFSEFLRNLFEFEEKISEILEQMFEKYFSRSDWRTVGNWTNESVRELRSLVLALSALLRQMVIGCQRALQLSQSAQSKLLEESVRQLEVSARE